MQGDPRANVAYLEAHDLYNILQHAEINFHVMEVLAHQPYTGRVIESLCNLVGERLDKDIEK